VNTTKPTHLNGNLFSQSIGTFIDVLGWASSPEPAKPSLFKPKPDLTLVKACSGLRPGFRYLKPEPGLWYLAYTLVWDMDVNIFSHTSNLK
jgi:hypothetical protein